MSWLKKLTGKSDKPTVLLLDADAGDLEQDRKKFENAGYEVKTALVIHPDTYRTYMDSASPLVIDPDKIKTFIHNEKRSQSVSKADFIVALPEHVKAVLTKVNPAAVVLDNFGLEPQVDGKQSLGVEQVVAAAREHKSDMLIIKQTAKTTGVSGARDRSVGAPTTRKTIEGHEIWTCSKANAVACLDDQRGKSIGA